MQPAPPSAHGTHDIFQAQAQTRQAVMFGNGHIDIAIGLQGIPVKGPFLQNPAVFKGHGNKMPVIGILQPEAFVFDLFQGRGHAGVLIAPPFLIAGPVKNQYPGGPGIQAEPDQLGHDEGMGIGSLFNGPVPADIGLDYHLVPGFNKGFHPAQGRRHGADHGRQVRALDHQDLGHINLCRPCRRQKIKYRGRKNGTGRPQSHLF